MNIVVTDHLARKAGPRRTPERAHTLWIAVGRQWDINSLDHPQSVYINTASEHMICNKHL